MGAEPAGVDDPLGDALVVEVEDLLAEVKSFRTDGPRGPARKGVLVVGDWDALLRGEARAVAGVLMGFAAGLDPLGARPSQTPTRRISGLVL